MATSPNYGWSEPDNTSLVRNGAEAIRTLGNSIDTTVAAIPNPNLIAGGSFDIWQRGTGPFTSGAIYTSDRFYVYSSSSYSLSQETSVVPTGATNAARITSTAGSSFANMQFALEQSEVEKVAGKVITFSVYLRANATYNGTTSLKINTSTTGNSQTPTWTTQAASTAAAPSTSAYTRFSVTATIPTTAKGLAFLIEQQSVLANGSIIYIALAKAELSSIATPFVRAGGTIQGELAACQRYYYRNTAGQLLSVMSGTMGADSTTTVDMPVNFPVTMRTTISSTLDIGNIVPNDGVTSSGGGTFAIQVARSGVNYATVRYTHITPTLVLYRPMNFIANSNAAAFIGFSAEL